MARSYVKIDTAFPHTKRSSRGDAKNLEFETAPSMTCENSENQAECEESMESGKPLLYTQKGLNSAKESVKKG